MFRDLNENMLSVMLNQIRENRRYALYKRKNDKFTFSPPPARVHFKYFDIRPHGPNTEPPKLLPKGAGRNDGF